MPRSPLGRRFQGIPEAEELNVALRQRAPLDQRAGKGQTGGVFCSKTKNSEDLNIHFWTSMGSSTPQ